MITSLKYEDRSDWMIPDGQQWIIDVVDYIESLGIEISSTRYTHIATGRYIERTSSMDGLAWYTEIYNFCTMIAAEQEEK